jgi:hypothetical protein
MFILRTCDDCQRGGSCCGYSFDHDFNLLFAGAVVAVIEWELDIQIHVQSVPITTNVVSSNPAHGEVYSIQHYVIKFVSYLRQVGGFLRVLRFPPPKKLI